MVLQSSGAITASQVNTELGLPTTWPFAMNDTKVRTLANRTVANSQILFSDFYGKTWGAAAQWAASVDGSGLEQGYSVAVDGNGNVYLAGRYRQSEAIIYNAGNASSGLTLRATSSYSEAAFVVKYNSSGTAQWAASVDGTSSDGGYSVAVDSSGNVYLAGYYGSASPTIYNAGNASSGLTLRATSGGDAAFVVKYNSSGTAQWAASVDGSGGEYGNSVAVDSSGNVYLAGHYGSASPTIYNAGNASSGLTLRATSGGSAAYVVKYNSSGAAQWAASVDGANNDPAESVAVDSSGNVYLAGHYGSASPTIYNAGNASSGLTLRASSSVAAFVVKYNSSGAAQWAASVDGSSAEYGFSVAVDISGNVYLAGLYGSNSPTIYNAGNVSSGLTLRASGSTAAFVVKYNNSGAAQWAASVDGSSADEGRSVAVDGSGNVYLAGNYVTFSPTIYNAGNASSGLTLRTPTRISYSDGTAAYVVKWNSSGTAQWAASVDGKERDQGNSVAVWQHSGNVYLAGIYDGYGNASPTIYNAGNVSSGLTLRTTSGGSRAAYVVKFTDVNYTGPNITGTAQWGASVDSNSFDTFGVIGRSVAVDGNGNVYLAGRYRMQEAIIYNAGNVSSGLTLRETSGNPGTGQRREAVYVVKYNSSGTAQWAASVDGSQQSERAFGVAVDGSGNVYLAGFYFSLFQTPQPITIYNAGNVSSGLTLRASNNFRAAFVVKWNSSGTAQWAASVDGLESDIGYSVAADGSGNVYLGGTYAGSPTIYNAGNVSSGLTLRNHTAPSFAAAFVVKWNSSGTAQWAASVDGTGVDEGFSVAVDGSGNVYLAGYYGGAYSSSSGAGATIYNAANASSGLTLRATSGVSAAFVVKYNSSGAAQWAVSVDGADTDIGDSVAVDGGGNVYLAGTYGGASPTIYNAGNASSGLTLRATTVDTYRTAAYVVKFNSSGTAQWGASVDGVDAVDAGGAAVDGSGNVYLAGYYGYSANIYNSTANATATIYNADNASSGLSLRGRSGYSAAFLVKWDSIGTAQWAVSIDGTGEESGTSVAVNSSGIYLGGTYGPASATIYNAGNVSSGLTLRNPTDAYYTSANAAFVVKFT
jgi:hypothetical protein